jgi:hypothetical protein
VSASYNLFICSSVHLFDGTIMALGVRYLALRLTVPAAGLTAMSAFALLYHLEPEYYYRALAFIGIRPFRYPFLDLQVILAGVDCWQHHIDVYVYNPCDVLGRAYDYSPLWLRFSILSGNEWTNPLGLCLVISFFLALAVLPAPRSVKELVPRLVATLSPVTTFAVERGNSDLLMFVMATAAGVLLLEPLRRRVLAYAMIVIAGLLKIYPLVLMALTLRERPRVFLWVNGAAAAVVLATYYNFYAEVVKMMSNIMGGAAFSDQFGAYILPDLIARMAGMATHPRLFGLVKVSTFAALFLAMVAHLLHVVRWRGFRIALARLPGPEKIFLLVGAALIGGCFFAGSNIGYRGIHLLFAVPGLLAMARTEGDMNVRRLAAQECVLVVALTWALFFTRNGAFTDILASWIGQVPGAHVVHFLWLLSQIVWWQVATFFIAILIGSYSDWLEVVGLEWRHRDICAVRPKGSLHGNGGNHSSRNSM